MDFLPLDYDFSQLAQQFPGDAAGGNPFSFDPSKIASGLKGVQAPPAPAVMPAPAGHVQPRPTAIPGGLQALYAMLAQGGGAQRGR